MIHCPYCYEPVDAGILKCPWCSSSVTWECTHCNRVIGLGAPSCPFCGTPAPKQDPAAPTPPPPPGQPPATPRAAPPPPPLPEGPGELSVVQPVGRAIERTKYILFSPWDAGKWFTLGFCAFLATLGEQGAISFNGGGDQSGYGQGGEQIKHWIEENMGTIVVVGAVILFLSIGLGILFTWLSSRGKFMFLDGVVRNRGAVVEPWKKFRRLGNSLFFFRLLFFCASFLVFILIIGACLAMLWPSIQSENLSSGGVAAIVVGFSMLLGMAVVCGLIQLGVEDFLIPAMYHHDKGVRDAWEIVRSQILSGRGGTIALYVLMKIGLALAIGVIAVLATCVTCCIAAIPYLGTVILLPLFVFHRSYSLLFIEQLGPEWRLFTYQDSPTRLET